MATWKVTAFVNSEVGRQTFEIDSSTPYGARDLINNIYNPQQIYKIEQVDGGFRQDSDFDSTGIGTIVGFLVCIWLFVSVTPFFMMFLFGTLGTKLSEILVGDNLENALVKSIRTDKNGVVIFIFLSLILSGGIGFYLGDKIQKSYFTNSTPSMIKK